CAAHGLCREANCLGVDVGRRKFLVARRLGDGLRRLVDATAVSAVLKKCQAVVPVAVYRLADELIHDNLDFDRANVFAKDAVDDLADHPRVTVTALEHRVIDSAGVLTGKKAATAAPL